MKLQMLGLCRFSYVGLRGYQVEHASFEERRAYLYAPERLARRWLWFTEVALPGWRAQTDPDFTLVVMTGPDLPEPYMSQLRAVVAQNRGAAGAGPADGAATWPPAVPPWRRMSTAAPSDRPFPP